MTPEPAVEFSARTLAAVEALREQLLATEAEHRAAIDRAAPAARASACNLVHYVALRQHDLRDLQSELASVGLSSLGRSEAHVLASLDAVLWALSRMSGVDRRRGPSSNLAPVDFRVGRELLRRNTQEMFGARPEGRDVRIMVTMPSEAASDPDLVRGLLDAGMDVMRINAAHDGPEAWERMVRNLRRASDASGRRCRVLIDLGGPKLRTGPIASQANVVRWKPARDEFGATIAPARVRLIAADGAVVGRDEDATLGIDVAALARLQAGDEISLTEARGRKLRLSVERVEATGGVIATCDDGAYVRAGTPLTVLRNGRTIASGCTHVPVEVDARALLRNGDVMVLTRDATHGSREQRDAAGAVVVPARVPCRLPEVFRDTRVGDRVWLDDGKVGGMITRVSPDSLEVRVTQAGPKGVRLGADKGINLPDSHLDLPALTAKDLADLDFAATHADMIGLSFLRSHEDVLLLEEELARRGAAHLGIMLKVETREAFENLPKILLTGLRSPPVGVMIARGDLAVEMGFERLAEVQEEILWLCEAAHVPVVWATQVLESMSKKGTPSRAEVTDAAMSVRAECVMLNKGPHAVATVRFLDNVLKRMQDHQQKKRAMLRKLRVSRFD